MAKLHIYKMINMGDYDTRSEIVWGTEVYTERGLRQRFYKMIDSLPKKLKDDYGKDCDFSQPQTIEIGTICDIINDICNYNLNAYYIVDETDLEVDEKELYRVFLESAALLAAMEKQTHPDRPITEITKSVVDHITRN